MIQLPKGFVGHSIAQKITEAGRLRASMAQWVKHGFPRVAEEIYTNRIQACRACEFWEEHSRLGYGKCKKCGCGRAKQWLPHESCPIGKWGQEPVP